MDTEDILTLNVAELRAKLSELDLAVNGNKVDLQKRLLEFYELHSRAREIDEGNVNGNENEDDVLYTTVAENVARRNSVASEVEITPHPNQRRQTEVLPVARSWFTLKDVEGSLSQFSGSGFPDINQWIEELEECALTVEWNDMQVFIYAKQLLSDAAKLFVRSQRDIRNWSDLKLCLVEEFGVRISSAEVHRRLNKRQQKKGETLREYLYALMEIAKQIDLEDESLIEYFVNGIPDSKSNKALLYQARNMKELKVQIVAYEKMRGPFKSLTKYDSRKSEDKEDKVTESARKCYSCGSDSHLRKDCPKREFRCFKCNQAGHKANQCKVDVAVKQEKSANMVQVKFKTMPTSIFTSSGLELKNVVHSKGCFQGLVDTGADLCLLRRNIFLKAGFGILTGTGKCLTGIGESQILTYGSLTIPVKIDNIEMNVEFHVISDNDMAFEAILGRTILKNVDLIVKNSGTEFVRKIGFDQIEEQGQKKKQEPCTNLINEFSALCSMNVDQVELIDVNLSHLNQELSQDVKKVIHEYCPKRNVNCAIQMKIVLTDDVPVFQHPRRLAYSEQGVVDEQIQEWLSGKIIKPSTSEYASPIVLVAKKNGKKRLCCDYRKLNEKIVRDNFPMIQMDSVIEKLQGAKVFTTLDLTNGYFHVPVAPESQKYTSFVTPKGQYEFLFVPFGISNSPAVFTRFIVGVMRELINKGDAVVYMDDIIIPSVSEREGLEKLKRVLGVAEKNGLRINWAKCQIIQSKVDFLGYVVEHGTIKPSREKTNAVENFPIPRDKKGIQRFLGLTSYFRKFVNGYAVIAKPLSDLLRKESRFVFQDLQQVAFEQLKAALVREPVLKLYDPKLITEIHTDASKFGFGAVLLQKDQGDCLLHPVMYMSRKTKPCEEKYHSYELEVLAVIEALKKWRVYVLGLKVKIITDCNAFAMTMKKKEVPLRVARWAMFLQDFNYEIEHRSGTKMKHVDALSRVACFVLTDSIMHRLKEAQMSDDWTKVVRKLVEQNGYEDFYLENQILFKDSAQQLIVVPSQMETEIIQIAHRQGHFSVKKTQDVIEKAYYIPRLKKKVTKIVNGCVECILVNAKSGRQEGFLNPIDKGDKPLVTYHVDHVGPMEMTKKRYNHIFVVVDGFSKFVWLYPTRSTGVEEVISCLERQAVNFGNPLRIVSDRGTAFTASAFKEYCEVRKIQHLLISTGVPRGNGQVERMHRIVIPMLSKLSIGNPGSWYKHIGRVQQIINNSEPRSTKVAPFKILTGSDMRCRDDLNLKEIMQQALIDELDEERDLLRKQARDNIKNLQEENKQAFDKKRKKEKTYNINDLVAIKRTQYGVGLKLKGKYLGPYKVVRVKNHGRYEVEKVGDGEGPMRTSTVAEFMKDFGSKPTSGGPNVGNRLEQISNERSTRSGHRY